MPKSANHSIPRPTIVVNAAAYTAVDLAEKEQKSAKILNADFPALLAELTKQRNSLLIDFSTDYVFDGSKSSVYLENDPTAPINSYGLTKLKGLQAIETSGCRHLVFRVSWVYSSRRINFLKTILRLAGERESLDVIDDQWGAPTSARWIAEMTALAIRLLDRNRGSEGVFNLPPIGKTTWHGFATAIVEAAWQQGVALKLKPESIQPIDTAGYPTPAARPKNSCLDPNKFQSEFGIEIPPWNVFVPLIVEETIKP